VLISSHLLLILLGIGLWILLHQAGALFAEKVICRNCGSVAPAKTVSPRSLVIELILWFSYLIPGVIYTLWCRHQTHRVCSRCGSRDIVPADSPVGRKLAETMMVDITPQSERNQ
jgi:hypothetical protein